MQGARGAPAGGSVVGVGGGVRVADLGDRVRGWARLSAVAATRRRGRAGSWMCRATLSSRVRVLGSGRSNKNDPNDARSVAIAALHAPNLAVVAADDHTVVLRMLAKANIDLGRAKNRAACRLHALVCEMVPGGIRKEVVVSQAESLLASIRPESMVQRQRLSSSSQEILDDIVRLNARMVAVEEAHRARRARVGHHVDRPLRSGSRCRPRC